MTVSAQAAVFVLGIASGVLAARLLGPQARGELAAVILWPTLLTFMFSMGNTQSIAFQAGKRIFDISEVWTAAVVMAAVFSACAVIAGFWIIPFALKQYSPEVRHLSLLFLTCAPLIWLTSVPAGLMQGRLEIGHFNILKLICPAVYAAGLVALYILRKPSVAWATASQALGFAVMDAFGVWLVFRKFSPRWAWNMRSLRALLDFGWKTQSGSMASYVNQRLDQLLLTVFVPPREAGLYVVAVAVATSLSFFPQAVEMVTLAEGSNVDPEQTKRIIAQSFGMTLLALSVGCTTLYLICPWLVQFAFGKSFGPAVAACRVLLPGSVALGLNQVLFSGARALGRPVLPSYAEGFAMVITCVLLYCLLPRYGLIGAAISSTVAYMGSMMFSFALLCFRADIRPFELAAEFPRLALRRINL